MEEGLMNEDGLASQDVSVTESQNLGFDADLLNSSQPEPDESSSKPRFPNLVGRRIAQVAIILIVTPLFFASIGAIVDYVLFGSGSGNINYHTRYAAFAALVATPLAVFRLLLFTFSNPTTLKRNLNIGDFLAYLLLSVAIGIALPRTILAGSEIFHAADHAKEIFTVKGMYEKIETQADVYAWLTAMTRNVFNDSFASDKGSRYVDERGRAVLLGFLRLRQNRVRPVKCDKKFADLGTVGRKECYPPYSVEYEDTTTYSRMNFTYYNTYYKTSNGRKQYPSDMIASTNTGSYSLAGFWTIFASDVTTRDCVDQIGDMREANWIDAQTRLVGVDAAIVFPDFHPHSTWGTMQMNILVTSSGKFLPQPFYFVPNYIPATEEGPAAGADPTTNTTNRTQSMLDQPVGMSLVSQIAYMQSAQFRKQAEAQGTPEVLLNGQCSIIVGALFLTPFYLGVFSALIYTTLVHICSAIHGKKQYLRSFFTYTELVWMLMILLSWVFFCLASYVQACAPSVFVLPPFPSATDADGSARTGLALRAEVQNLGHYWAQARNVLGLSLFLHLFNFLKFLVKFKSLGALIRTLSLAAPELLSFSVSFSVIFIAFVTMFFILFSVDAVEFMSYERSTISLWLGMLGELEVTSALWKNKSWAIPMIILFTFISVFVLLTLIVAIVSNAHERTKTVAEGDAILQEQRIFDVVYHTLSKQGRQPRVHPSNEASLSNNVKAQLSPFRSPIQQWISRARQRRLPHSTEKDANPPGQSTLRNLVLNDGVRRNAVADSDNQSESHV